MYHICIIESNGLPFVQHPKSRSATNLFLTLPPHTEPKVVTVNRCFFCTTCSFTSFFHCRNHSHAMQLHCRNPRQSSSIVECWTIYTICFHVPYTCTFTETALRYWPDFLPNELLTVVDHTVSEEYTLFVASLRISTKDREFHFRTTTQSTQSKYSPSR